MRCERPNAERSCTHARQREREIYLRAHINWIRRSWNVRNYCSKWRTTCARNWVEPGSFLRSRITHLCTHSCCCCSCKQCSAERAASRMAHCTHTKRRQEPEQMMMMSTTKYYYGWKCECSTIKSVRALSFLRSNECSGWVAFRTLAYARRTLWLGESTEARWRHIHIHEKLYLCALGFGWHHRILVGQNESTR